MVSHDWLVMYCLLYMVRWGIRWLGGGGLGGGVVVD
mgnify:CR=1 FL=1